jgi:flagellar motor switch protein FliN
MIDIYYPYLTVEPIIGKLFAQFWYSHVTHAAKSILPNCEDLPIQLTAEIFTRNYPLKEILKWDIGTVIQPLRPSASDCCYLKIGDKRVWQCQTQPDYRRLPKRIAIVKYAEKSFEMEENIMEMEKINPLVADAVSEAKMRVSVELGRAFKTVKEVYAFGEGTILELEKFAGEPLDVFVNGILIAKGEAVVIDENFGVRITEITGASGQTESQQPAPEPTAEEASFKPNADEINESLQEAVKEAFEETK